MINTKYDYERVQQEIRRTQQYVEHNKLSKLLDSIQMSLSSSIQSLTDIQLRQQLSERHHNIIQQYKNEMITIFTDTMGAKLNESETLFNNKVIELCQKHSLLPVHEQLNQSMIQLISRYGLSTTEKFQCIYQYKNVTLTN